MMKVKMNMDDYELEIILTSKYCEIILEILKVHKNLSVNKTMVFAYIKKKMQFNKSILYTARNKKSIVLKCLSVLSGNISDYCNNIKYVLSAIHILVANDLIAEHVGELIFIEDGKQYLGEKSFFYLAVEESKKISDKQFMREVIKNV